MTAIEGQYHVEPNTDVKVVATPGNIYHVEGWTNADHQRYTTGIADSIVVLSEALGEIPSMTPLLVHNR